MRIKSGKNGENNILLYTKAKHCSANMMVVIEKLTFESTFPGSLVSFFDRSQINLYDFIEIDFRKLCTKLDIQCSMALLAFANGTYLDVRENQLLQVASTRTHRCP